MKKAEGTEKVRLEKALLNAKKLLDETGIYVTWPVKDELDDISKAISDLEGKEINKPEQIPEAGANESAGGTSGGSNKSDLSGNTGEVKSEIAVPLAVEMKKQVKTVASPKDDAGENIIDEAVIEDDTWEEDSANESVEMKEELTDIEIGEESVPKALVLDEVSDTAAGESGNFMWLWACAVMIIVAGTATTVMLKRKNEEEMM